MVGESVDRHRIRRPRQIFDDVSNFEYILTLTGWVLPERSYVVQPIEAHKGIVEEFSDLMAMRGYVLESASEQTWTDPARIIQHIEPREIAIGRESRSITRLHIKCMEAKHAAAPIRAAKKIRVGKQEGGDVLGSDTARQFSGANNRIVVGTGGILGEQLCSKDTFPNQHEAAGGAVGIQCESICREAFRVHILDDRHYLGVLHAGVQKRVPIGPSMISKFG